jgi:hypothetical protein
MSLKCGSLIAAFVTVMLRQIHLVVSASIVFVPSVIPSEARNLFF